MLERRGIALSAVPVITSVFGLASRLGISLIHPDHAHSVRFVANHSRKGVLPIR
ncbi:hypothetical protein [Devosia psychrophila]|uniref:Uroporphyrin-III C-methyltransferase / precorrin-2 dehydrogenase / sirohydrochlorin ferrochelatase n=1 Tax=Devosia psychrophila TaxID=728005 RepID=A0A1I1MFZ6_9HYPH|nr:hypothetical protein [Devosia psychrophila]SFC82008.1 uroporphyrin-III C-methyltransferase / precorrin-2 dehydrogenase / sirohydrochlorin ferrochelatase [Devosia psychrophila]